MRLIRICNNKGNGFTAPSPGGAVKSVQQRTAAERFMPLERARRLSKCLWPRSYSLVMDTQAIEPASKPDLPDRLDVNPKSPHYRADIFEHDVGIRFNGKERFDVEAYCVSEGWIQVPAGKTVDRRGKPLMLKIKGTVEAFYR
jgi:hypothetical protein